MRPFGQNSSRGGMRERVRLLQVRLTITTSRTETVIAATLLLNANLTSSEAVGEFRSAHA